MTARAGTVLVIGGPTASGKSGLALAVTAARNGVVINADSMQVYDGLPLLTAQPSAEEKAEVPHRLYAALPPDEVCSAARWTNMAIGEIRAAQAEGRLPVIVGGTGFYIKTLLEGISPIPDVPESFRQEAIALQKELGHPAFHAELARRDPETAAKLDPFNTQRLVRAWEVLAATGKSLSTWQAAPRVKPPADLAFLTVTLLPPRETLYAACDGRFGKMLEAGALEEAKAFMEKETDGMALSKALGYPELKAHIAGQATREEATRLAQQSTRNYAKRQTTWFRHQIKADIVLESPDPAPFFNNLP
ncbi:MAG: tRNA (adenosine(37)-N6)-dimethylallyltransferase MiaA [Alphaproteobacteria bacterium]|nr:tRNA (adenosine(37)-N6)-dimethylallyltransferase MiaA [Alphaproteobacteria bacterium]MDE2336702.1 tRNA (adenosine(37)-N6)-dimethylallyltransferase MiaA [Alphaproteobacteria bacterium]